MAERVPAIEIRGLRKVFRARSQDPVVALDGVDLTVEPGEVFGFLGRNGAGKTTTVKILTGLIPRYEGECRINGTDVREINARRRVGLLPEAPDFHGWLNAIEVLLLHATLHGLARRRARARAAELLTLVGIEESAWRRKVGTFSKGMTQRLALATALVAEPDVVFLDEPTANLDPVGRRDVQELLLGLERQGKTVFLNSHVLSDVELACSRIAILERGRIVASGDVADLARVQPYVHIRTTAITDAMLAELRERSSDVAVLDGVIVMRIRTESDMDPIPGIVEKHGARLRHLELARETLEDVFFRTVETDGTRRGSGIQ